MLLDPLHELVHNRDVLIWRVCCGVGLDPSAGLGTPYGPLLEAPVGPYAIPDPMGIVPAPLTGRGDD
jgi:hypothetical protein